MVPGVYTATEADPAPLFDLTSIVCTGDTAGGTTSSGDLITDTATFNLDPELFLPTQYLEFDNPIRFMVYE